MSKLIPVFLLVTTPILLAWILFGSSYASAESGDQRMRGLTVSPLRTELEISPGTSQNGTLKVTNTTGIDMTVQFSSEAFSVINQQYDYAFDAESKLSDWVHFSQSEINLSPEASVNIGYTVGVPLNAEPGGRYISLFASTDTGSTVSSINSRQRIGSLLYITVLGDVTREGHLLGLTSPLFMGDSSPYSMTLQNTGSTHYASRYSVTLNNLFGGVVSSMSDESLILPGTIRQLVRNLPTPKWPGIYKAIYSVGLGDTPASIETHYIVYLPPVAIVVLAVTAILTTSLIVRRHSVRSKPKKTDSPT